ncbi:MAG: glycosyltransferase family 39 protein [Planctomycetota bacterium]
MAGAGYHRVIVRDALSLALVALIVRVSWLWVHPSYMVADPDAYGEIARTLADTGVYGVRYGAIEPSITAFRPPLYPWLISWFVNSEGLDVTGVAWMHLVMGVVTALGVWSLVLHYHGQRSVAWLAGGLVVVDPLLLNQSSQLMTETLAAFLVVAIWWTYVMYHRVVDRSTPPDKEASQARGQEVAVEASTGERTRSARAWIALSALLGCLLTLAYLCRPTFLVWSLMLIAGDLFLARRNRRARRVGGVIALSMVMLGVTAWTLRNQHVLQRPVWATTHGGYTLLLGNNDWFYDHLVDRPWLWPWHRRSWQPEAFFAAYQERVVDSIAGECRQDDASKEWAMETIKRRPMTAIWASLQRVIRLWNPFPASVPGRSKSLVLGVGLFYCCKSLAVAACLFRYRRCLLSAWWWTTLSLAITLTTVHSLYWSNPRMRAPIAPMTAAVAALAFGAHARRDVRVDSVQEPAPTTGACD